MFLEDPEAYRREVIAAGTPPEVADRAIRRHDRSHTAGRHQSHRGRATGETTLIATNYLGRRALHAYAPLNLKGLDWVIIASIDSGEAFAPESAFGHRLVRATVLVIFVARLLAMVWAKLFVRPIKRLEAGAEKISTGDYDVTLPVASGDEFGDLTVAFNEMSRSLAIKDQLLDPAAAGERSVAVVADAGESGPAVSRRRAEHRRGPPGCHRPLRRPDRPGRVVRRP